MSKFEKQPATHPVPGRSLEETRRYFQREVAYTKAAVDFARKDTSAKMVEWAEGALKKTTTDLLKKVEAMPSLPPEDVSLSEHVETTRLVYEKVRLAQELGMKDDLVYPAMDDPIFDSKMTAIAHQMDQFVEQCYKDFETTLSQDADMLALLTELEYAQFVAKEATVGEYATLAAAKERGLEATLWQRTKLLFGGNGTVERGQVALDEVTRLRDSVVTLAIEKFKAAGLNKDPKRALTPETATFERVENIMGIHL
ncbi:MAG: hypothetical protein Q8O53_00580 [Candidatus Moranbacteria bacterium]|nr:hypothetical protein [Candidatus Moranbacteria bacterium]